MNDAKQAKTRQLIFHRKITGFHNIGQDVSNWLILAIVFLLFCTQCIDFFKLRSNATDRNSEDELDKINLSVFEKQAVLLNHFTSYFFRNNSFRNLL